MSVAVIAALGAMTLGPAKALGAGRVMPNAVSMVDCNGHSPAYKAVKPGLGGLCTDPIEIGRGGSTDRFEDNNVYVGHDEPSVKFISNASGSGNDMTYLMRLPVDPNRTPTATSTAVSKYGELSIAPWFGLPMCDPKSYPQNACTPDSDANSGAIADPNGAGSAFMELQLYAPGFPPFVDGVSCDATHYCAALTIDSLECTFGFATCNANCEEPVNFAYLQRDGVPAGPPSPQLTDVSTFSPNGRTLMMNPGDVVSLRLHDTAHGLRADMVDLTTRQSGFIVASAANGFMNTNIADCSGTPFDFHPEYSSAAQRNQVPWAALEGGVLMQTEIGHFEPCSSVANALPVDDTFPDGQSFSDPQVFQTCMGGLEPGSVGEGPCDPGTGVCANATTEGGLPCSTNNFASGALCEFSDANCMPGGARRATVNGRPTTFRWPIAGCLDTRFQNGDLDFDGTSYRADWPDGAKGHPTPFEYLGPFTSSGGIYPTIQFETNVGASESLCNTATGAGCTALPVGAEFYPFWTLGSTKELRKQANGLCVWNFGDVIPKTTAQDFGGPAEYGTPDVARFGGTLTSAQTPNPQFTTRCR